MQNFNNVQKCIYRKYTFFKVLQYNHQYCVTFVATSNLCTGLNCNDLATIISRVLSNIPIDLKYTQAQELDELSTLAFQIQFC